MKTIMAFGTFDHLHPGHLSYLEQARRQGDKLIVVVARDVNVEKIKGKKPRQNENIRLARIKELDIVDKAMLGGEKDRLLIVEKNQPDVITLGYDQQVDIRVLKKRFKGDVIRLKAYKPEKYKSSKIVN
ncbi:adenylyltransferase/cytidyltransferase family protein [Candidatus Parcubacteria bacterium]|nr:adenylyltransferase/cytidyltransferase family protein [Candidatus Parcubacteria bacterium]